MNSKLLLAAGMIVVSMGCSGMEDGMSRKDPWTGKYKFYSEIPGANDGSHSYRLEIKKSGDRYDVSYSESSMVASTYKGAGRENKAGGLEVSFSSLESTVTFAKNFKPGNRMFTLERVDKGGHAGVKLDWEMVPGDDLRKGSVTLERE